LQVTVFVGENPDIGVGRRDNQLSEARYQFFIFYGRIISIKKSKSLLLFYGYSPVSNQQHSASLQLFQLLLGRALFFRVILPVCSSTLITLPLPLSLTNY
jgi:hypothetical protein